MPEAPKVSKTYLSTHLFLSVAFVEANGKRVSMNFVNGDYTTDDAEKQAHIEGLDGFGVSITIAPTPKEAAVAKAKELRAIAVKANAEAKTAEDAAAAFDAKKAAVVA